MIDNQFLHLFWNAVDMQLHQLLGQSYVAINHGYRLPRKEPGIYWTKADNKTHFVEFVR